MYFIITTMAWSRCRRRLEGEQEGGAQGPPESRHEGRVSQAARKRDLRAVERELRGERHGGSTQCSGRSIAERRVGAAGPQEEPERARAEGYGTPREHGSAFPRRRLPYEVQRIQHQCREPVRRSISPFLQRHRAAHRWRGGHMHCCGRATHGAEHGWRRCGQQCVVGEPSSAQLAQRAAAKTKHQCPVCTKHVSTMAAVSQAAQ